MVQCILQAVGDVTHNVPFDGRSGRPPLRSGILHRLRRGSYQLPVMPAGRETRFALPAPLRSHPLASQDRLGLFRFAEYHSGAMLTGSCFCLWQNHLVATLQPRRAFAHSRHLRCRTWRIGNGTGNPSPTRIVKWWREYGKSKMSSRYEVRDLCSNNYSRVIAMPLFSMKRFLSLAATGMTKPLHRKRSPSLSQGRQREVKRRFTLAAFRYGGHSHTVVTCGGGHGETATGGDKPRPYG